MKSLRIAVAMILPGCGPAFAQVGMTGSPTRGLDVTSPLGMLPGAPVAQTRIPSGTTELTAGLQGAKPPCRAGAS
jgi:hypothetical protein